MNIALLMEHSQFKNNHIIASIIKEVIYDHRNHDFYNLGMINHNDQYLTYIHLGIISSILLNAKAIDFIITGCATGQGALISLNAFPGVICGYCNDYNDALLFKNIHNGNAISLAFDKFVGGGGKLNLKEILCKILNENNQLSSPVEDRERNIKDNVKLKQIKLAVAKNNFVDILDSLDYNLLDESINGESFLKCYFANSQNMELDFYILNKLNKNNQILFNK